MPIGLTVDQTNDERAHELCAIAKGEDCMSQDVRAALRIHAAKETAVRVGYALQAADDLRFWLKRIKRAIEGGKYTTNNTFSFRGNAHPYYMEALQKLLGEPFKVGRTNLLSLFGTCKDYVRVEW